MKHTYTRGFTLIELLVVVLIIGILASIAVPQYQKAVHRARIKSYMPVVRDLVEAQEVYYMANGRYSRDIEELSVNYPSECVKNFYDNGDMQCDNHIELNAFYDDNSRPDYPLSVGMTYCYDGSRPCGYKPGENHDIQIHKVFQNLYEGSILAGWEGKWLCICWNSNDKFCKKVCSSIGENKYRN